MSLATKTIPYFFGLSLCFSFNLWAGNYLANPLINGTYQGNVILNTQADIDAFSYAFINGNLLIGYQEADVLTSDSYNLKTLKNVETGYWKLRNKAYPISTLGGAK